MASVPYIKDVYIFTNGQVMVFDQNGQQMPQFQGNIDDVLPKILRERYSGKIHYMPPEAMEDLKRGYTLHHDLKAITCHTCKLTSYNRMDYLYRYCGHCHKFHEGVGNEA